MGSGLGVRARRRKPPGSARGTGRGEPEGWLNIRTDYQWPGVVRRQSGLTPVDYVLHDQHGRSVRVVIANTNHAKFSATQRDRVARAPSRNGGLEGRRISGCPAFELEPEQKPCHSVAPSVISWGRPARRAYDKSRAIEQLSSSYGDKYTYAQAVYAANALGL